MIFQTHLHAATKPIMLPFATYYNIFLVRKQHNYINSSYQPPPHESSDHCLHSSHFCSCQSLIYTAAPLAPNM